MKCCNVLPRYLGILRERGIGGDHSVATAEYGCPGLRLRQIGVTMPQSFDNPGRSYVDKNSVVVCSARSPNTPAIVIFNG